MLGAGRVGPGHTCNHAGAAEPIDTMTGTPKTRRQGWRYEPIGPHRRDGLRPP